MNVAFDMVDIQEEENIAFGTALISYQAIAMDNTVSRGMKNRITVCFVKKNGVWKVRHQHTSAPINSELGAILNY